MLIIPICGKFGASLATLPKPVVGAKPGTSYFVNPKGEFLVKGSTDKDEIVMADLDLEMIREVRDGWQFFRDRRPEMYEDICKHLP